MGKSVAPLDPDINLALRELAGWPLHTMQRNQFRDRHHTMTIHRDQFGRIIGSVEHLEEHEHDGLTESFGK